MSADPRLVSLLEASTRALIFSGAGISTGSGIPDYRGPQGVWKRRRPVYYQDFMTSEAARIEYWDFKLELRQIHRNRPPGEMFVVGVLTPCPATSYPCEERSMR